ncbi:MAG: DUF4294 domain-containing protein [Bacteroidales bacterium]|nr:DUF4294 domain-containing protein [Bacteroidales bacterium]
MKTRIFFIIVSLALLVGRATPASAQAQHGIVCLGTILDGDTIPLFILDEVKVSVSWSLLTKEEIRQNQKLIRNIKKMLPYAKEGKRRMEILDRQCAKLKPRQRKELIKQAEKDLLDDYTEELKNCTISQGKVLLKLIDRETGQTSYMIVDELRGKLRASFYQTFARVFGYNMKERYDPQHNAQDDLIERICLSVEQGKL